MKKMFYVFAIIIALAITACGTKKTATKEKLTDSITVDSMGQIKIYDNIIDTTTVK